MSYLLGKLKKIDKKILVGAGVGVTLIIVLIIALIAGGNNEPANDDDKQSGAEVKNQFEEETQNPEEHTEQDSESKTETQNSEETKDAENSTSESNKNSNLTNEQLNDNTSESKNEQNMSSSEQKPSTSEDNKKDEPNKSEGANSDKTPVTEAYTVNVYSSGGHRLYNVKVNVYADNTMSDLVSSASTNSSGKATLKLVPSDDYVFTLSNVAEGYQLKSSYTFSGKSATIILTSSLVNGNNISASKLKEGDVMYDFSVTNARGQTITLSELLKTKKMVMLNFWYINCKICVAEFPAMSSAYSKYAKDVEIIALNPFDNMDAVKGFLNENPLRFQVATCPTTLPDSFGVMEYPVSVIIDRYGVIREIKKQGMEEEDFINLFKRYTNM